MKKLTIFILASLMLSSQAVAKDFSKYKELVIVNGCQDYDDCMNKSEDVFQFTNDARTVAVLKAIAMELRALNKNLTEQKVQHE